MQTVYGSDFWHPGVFGCADHESDVRFEICSHEVVLFSPGLSRGRNFPGRDALLPNNPYSRITAVEGRRPEIVSCCSTPEQSLLLNNSCCPLYIGGILIQTPRGLGRVSGLVRILTDAIQPKIKRVLPPGSPQADRLPVVRETVVRLKAPKCHLVTGELQSEDVAFDNCSFNLKFTKLDHHNNYYIEFSLGLSTKRGQWDYKKEVEFDLVLAISGPDDEIERKQVKLSHSLNVSRGYISVHQNKIATYGDNDQLTVEATIRVLKKYLK